MAVSSTGSSGVGFSRRRTSLVGLRLEQMLESWEIFTVWAGEDRLHDVLSARRVGGNCVSEQAVLPAYIVYWAGF